MDPYEPHKLSSGRQEMEEILGREPEWDGEQGYLKPSRERRLTVQHKRAQTLSRLKRAKKNF